MNRPGLPASNELDHAASDQLKAWAAILVLGWKFEWYPLSYHAAIEPSPKQKFHGCWREGNSVGVYYDLPSFAFSLDAAERLIRAIREEWLAEKAEQPLIWYWQLLPVGPLWLAEIMRTPHLTICQGSGDEIALAVTKAAIRYKLLAYKQDAITEEQLTSLKLFNEGPPE